MAEQGVTVDEAMATVRYAIGGDNIASVRQPNNTTIPLSLQFSPEYIDTLDKVRNTPVVTGDGRSVPLRDIADVSVRKMPEMMRNDNGKLAGYIYVDIQNVTGPDYVDSARQFLAKNLTLPTGYTVEWTGLYQYAAAARERLLLVVPLTLVIIFALLVIAFRSVSETLLILMSVPFALAGGVFLQWLLGYPMTTAVIARLHLAVRRGRADRHHHGDVHPNRARPSASRSVVRRGGDRRFGEPGAAEADDRGGDRPVAPAGHVHDRRRRRDRDGDCRAEHRRHGQLEPACAVHDPVPLRHRRRHPPVVATPVWPF